jgi:hypothetical protein
MAGRTFLMDGQAISNDEQYSSDEGDDNDDEEGEEEGEMEYMHYATQQQYQDEQEGEEDEEEFDTLTEENVPVMPTDFYSDVDNFLSKPPPGIGKTTKSKGGGKKKNAGSERGQKSSAKSLPVISDVMSKMNVQSKVSSHRTGPGSRKAGAHKVLDEKLLQQAFEYSNKLQQEAMVEEVYEASMNMQAQKSSSAPMLRPQQQQGGGGGGYSERKPRSADTDFQQGSSSSSTSRQNAAGQGGQAKKKSAANSVVRRLRSKTQTNANGNSGKPPRNKAKSGGFDTSSDAESATSTRNVTDFQSLVSNFEQGTHLQQLREELEQSKASMAQSRRAMQDISKEMSGKLRI